MIAVFACNRPEFLKPCLDSLQGENAHVFVDAVEAEGPNVRQICQASAFPVYIEKERKGLGFQRRKALQMFLDDASLGDDFMLCDSDVVFGQGATSLMRNELDFWWRKGYPIGMLCCGYQLQSTTWLVMKNEGHAVIPAHGGETVAMFPRQVLEKTGNCINDNMLGNTAPLKNRLAKIGHPRAILVEPMPNVQHVGALQTVLSPQWAPADLIFRDREGNPLNPRPDLFDILPYQDRLSADIMEKRP